MLSKSTVCCRFTALCILFALTGGLCTSADAAFELVTDFQNLWLNTNAPVGPVTNWTPRGTIFWGGHAGGYRVPGREHEGTNTPSGGGFQLERSAFGHPVEENRPDFKLGEVIAPPRGANTNVAPDYIFPTNAAFYAPSRKQVFAANGGNMLVDWIMNDGTTNRRVYFISFAPIKRPVRLFWTEAPWYAPKVNLTDKHVTLHYNSRVPGPPSGVDPTNYTSTVWVDDNNGTKQLRGLGCSGLFILEYFETGSKTKQVDIELVEVCEPEVHTQSAEIGRRLLPRDDSFGYDDLRTRITRGISETPHKVYKHASSDGKSAREGWLFPIWKTKDTPWEIEVYWEHQGVMDVVWPFEVSWYAADWPEDPQLFVRGHRAGDLGARMLIPSSIQCDIMPFEEPEGIGVIDNNSFYTTGQGYTLLKYYAGEEVWFEPVSSVYHDNHHHFDLAEEDWPIGRELEPVDIESAIDLSGASGSYLGATSGWTVTGRHERTVECWANVRAFDNGGLFQSGARATGEDFSLRTLDSNEWFRIQLYGAGYDIDVHLPDSLNAWHHYALTYDGKRVSLFYDGVAATTKVVALDTAHASFYMGTWSSDALNGQIDEVRVWNRARTPSQIRDAMYRRFPAGHDDLLADYTFQEAGGPIAYDRKGWHHAALFGSATYVEVDRHNLNDPNNWTSFPGYVYAPMGNRYNADLYAYPTLQDPEADSHVFAVHSNRLEVWWAEPSSQDGLPEPIYWPALVNRYDNYWPTNIPQIVIAGQNAGRDGAGKLSTTWLSPSVYAGNNSDAPGYNPNEEHALIIGDMVYALRDDLNASGHSPPVVLVQYVDGSTGDPDMQLYSVIRTNAQYDFTFNGFVSELIQPPMPLTVLDNTALTIVHRGPAWRDKNGDYWAYAAERYGTGAVDVVMHYFYPMQPSFDFPDEATQPPEGYPVPWLTDSGLNGEPVDVTYSVTWPADAPVLHIGETLVKATRGLPDIADQLSVTMLYQESQWDGANVNAGVSTNTACEQQNLYNHCFEQVRFWRRRINASAERSVVLIDPTRPRHVGLSAVPADIETHIKEGKKFFPALPPSLASRLYYDPNLDGGSLVIEGEYVEPPAGERYLLLNLLTEREKETVLSLSADSDWANAVNGLPSGAFEIDDDHTPFDSLALTAGIGQGTGYVVFAVNNSTNLAPPGAPVSVYAIRVDAPLYQGEIKDIFPDNPLDEQLTLRHSGDFAGRPGNYEFEWKRLPPDNGTAPTNDPTTWIAHSNGVGAVDVTIGEHSGLLAIEDQYFICRYRPLHPDSPVGTNTWSEWTDTMLAPGWVQRVMNAINPFEQRITDLENLDVDTRIHMISQAGPPYEGDVALNMDHINDYGLIELYQTVFNRAARMSIESGFDDTAANDALRLAATRINALYMLLGNEAFGDAMDPTIAFSSRDDWVGYESYLAEATSLFCFMNQAPNLLGEELALLYGRDDTFDPSVETRPIYNRLMWNFTKGIDGGELAYALNYDIRNQDGSLDGQIDEADAAVLYPQGHGDAWGHYLSAIKTYYRLLRHTNYTWKSDIGAMVVGGVTLNVDYYDEERFAESAAARARTGVELIERVHQAGYEEHREGLWSGFRDGDTNRAWGLAEWGSRAGQSALFDWAVGNSLLPYADTNSDHTGIEIIDRQTIPALRDVAASAGQIQQWTDYAGENMNPLGLARDAVPFDISPAEIDNGKTHFEQVYERALAALQNAETAFEHAKAANLRLRAQAESLYNFQIAHRERELDYHNRLIEIFGYPYADDIGPGKTYPADYDGPDLYHALYLDLESLGGQAVTVTPIRIQSVSLDADGSASDDDYDWTLNHRVANTVTYHFAESGLMAKPPEWTGTRRAPGDIQRTWTDFVRGLFELRRSAEEFHEQYDNLRTQYDHYKAKLDNLDDIYSEVHSTYTNVQHFAKHIRQLKVAAEDFNVLGEVAFKGAEALVEAFPRVNGVDNDFTSTPRFYAKAGGTLLYFVSRFVIANSLNADALKHEQENEDDLMDMDIKLASLDRENERLRMEAEMRIMIRRLNVLEEEIYAKVTALQTLQQNALAVVARGERLLYEREFVRSAAAGRIQRARYADMTFRIMRDEALQKYRAAFDLAARYVYLAAKAYDYETALLDTDAASTPGSQFLSSIARTRSLGIMQDGVPLPSRSYGDPGLADAMARMKAEWDVVKSRFGFNNPETETSRFSLRSELLRISPSSHSDDAWRKALHNHHWVDDITADPYFRKYCRPFQTATNAQPALVFTFPSIVAFGKNYFGHNLAGGDNAYDSSHAATKIRSVGVWFTGYNTAFNTNDVGGGLANEPRVYLFPCGEDIMRSPTGNGDRTRSWQVFDQALPLPYNIGQSDLDDPAWIPVNDSLSESFAKMRRYASLRAYHDRGQFDESETHNNARLIGRSVWNTRWMLIIPGGTLLSDPVEGLNRFIYGDKNPDGTRKLNGVKDIKIFYQTYSVWGE